MEKKVPDEFPLRTDSRLPSDFALPEMFSRFYHYIFLLVLKFITRMLILFVNDVYKTQSRCIIMTLPYRITVSFILMLYEFVDWFGCFSLTRNKFSVASSCGNVQSRIKIPKFPELETTRDWLHPYLKSSRTSRGAISKKNLLDMMTPGGRAANQSRENRNLWWLNARYENRLAFRGQRM